MLMAELSAGPHEKFLTGPNFTYKQTFYTIGGPAFLCLHYPIAIIQEFFFTVRRPFQPLQNISTDTGVVQVF